MPYGDQVSDEFRIDPNAPKLVYVQVADHITARIAAGELAPGARLPAERDLAAEYGVAYDTIRRRDRPAAGPRADPHHRRPRHVRLPGVGDLSCPA